MYWTVIVTCDCVMNVKLNYKNGIMLIDCNCKCDCDKYEFETEKKINCDCDMWQRDDTVYVAIIYYHIYDCDMCTK